MQYNIPQNIFMKISKKLLQYKYIFLHTVLCLLFFYPLFIFGKIPIPADTIVGMYHPWRDVVWDGLTAGVPFKNSLITDPVRQQYVWRLIALSQVLKGQMPTWNPYSFSGTPLLANFQTALFYPLNILFFLVPVDFSYLWGSLVFLQPLLAGIFLYLYLKHLKLNDFASFIGSFSYAFCGFSIMWMEWNTILHTVLWVPLIFLLIDTLIEKLSIKRILLLIFALCSSIFAGHLQILFYSMLLCNVYLFLRIVQKVIRYKKDLPYHYIKKFIPFLLVGLTVLFITSVSWVPTFQFIQNSAREFDQGSFMKEGWFIPWQNLVQYIAPDYFGNPVTNNYWGIWNYAEFCGYIGIVPLIFVLYALFFRKDKKTLFFALIATAGLLFSLPTPLAQWIYVYKIPFLSTSQPTRLLSIISLAFCIIAALGIDIWQKEKYKLKIVLILLLLFLGFIVSGAVTQFLKPENASIALKNLIFPTVIFVITTLSLLFILFIKRKKDSNLIPYIIIVLVVVDLFRFGWKFLPFSKKEWLYPQTSLTHRMKIVDNDPYRIITLDRRIFPPNFSDAYLFQDVSGYDPLYINRYGQFVAAWQRGKPDITPAAFNRIITPSDFESSFADLLGIKYILSYGPVESQKLQKIASEGQTYLYENTKTFPRVFFVETVQHAQKDTDEIGQMFQLNEKLRTTAVTQSDITVEQIPLSEDEYSKITSYTENKMEIHTKTNGNRLLIITDPYYPTWKAQIDTVETRLYQVDFVFKGVLVPQGEHIITVFDTFL
jgi:hypothetical protein